MSEKQWVQHISGHGEKFKLSGGDRACNSDMTHSTWVVDGEIAVFYLPKSEYRLCEPPEVWKDVTELCEISRNGDVTRDGQFVAESSGYRFRKVTLYAMARPIIDPMQREVAAFIVEQKVKS